MVTANAWPPAWLTPVPDTAITAGKGESVIDFAEIFGIITKDSIAGKAGSPLILREWQKELLRHVFARGDDGGLRHRINLIGMPRKQGKSALASTLGVFSLYASGVKGAEVYSCAADRDQARIVFADAKRMVEASPDLMGMAKLYRDAIEIPDTNSVYRVLSSEAFTKEGLSPTTVIFDELHAQPNRELFDVMSLAQGARGSMATLIAITTAGVKTDSTGQDSICYSLYQYGKRVARGEVDDPSFFMSWWEAPQEADHRLQETWEIANPGLGDICALSDFESSVRRTPEAEFRTKRCNQWVSSQTAWLPAGAWQGLRVERELSVDDEIVLGKRSGVDITNTTDLKQKLNNMNIEDNIKSNLLIRGFSNDTLLNNRGLIGATIDETILELVKNLPIANVSGECEHPYYSVSRDKITELAKCSKCGKEWY